MKTALSRIVYTATFIAVTLWAGWHLGAFISRFSFAMPYWLDVSIRALLHFMGKREPYDPEDIEDIGLFALFLGCWLAVVLLLGTAWIMALYWKRKCTSK